MNVQEKGKETLIIDLKGKKAEILKILLEIKRNLEADLQAEIGVEDEVLEADLQAEAGILPEQLLK
ncbi:hypothetical protein ACFLZ6_00320 [Nanoarchaeota archaeon]